MNIESNYQSECVKELSELYAKKAFYVAEKGIKAFLMHAEHLRKKIEKEFEAWKKHLQTDKILLSSIEEEYFTRKSNEEQTMQVVITFDNGKIKDVSMLRLLMLFCLARSNPHLTGSGIFEKLGSKMQGDEDELIDFFREKFPSYDAQNQVILDFLTHMN